MRSGRLREPPTHPWSQPFPVLIVQTVSLRLFPSKLSSQTSTLSATAPRGAASKWTSKNKPNSRTLLFFITVILFARKKKETPKPSRPLYPTAWCAFLPVGAHCKGQRATSLSSCLLNEELNTFSEAMLAWLCVRVVWWPRGERLGFLLQTG